MRWDSPAEIELHGSGGGGGDRLGASLADAGIDSFPAQDSMSGVGDGV